MISSSGALTFQFALLNSSLTVLFLFGTLEKSRKECAYVFGDLRKEARNYLYGTCNAVLKPDLAYREPQASRSSSVNQGGKRIDESTISILKGRQNL